MIRVILFCFLSFLFFGCQDEFTENSTDGELNDLFRVFEIEGAKRGLNIDLEQAGVSGYIEEISESGVAGKCFFNSHAPNEIVIDESFWQNADSRLREMVVFHELGHCYLGRGHREDQTNNGICLSIMRSGLGSCRDNYTTNSRSFYLDELFGQE